MEAFSCIELHVIDDDVSPASWISATMLYIQYLGIFLVDRIDLGAYGTFFNWTKFFVQPLRLGDIDSNNLPFTIFGLAIITLIPLVLLFSMGWRRYFIRNWSDSLSSTGIDFYLLVSFACLLLVFGLFFLTTDLNSLVAFSSISIGFVLLLSTFGSNYCRLIFEDSEEYQQLFLAIKSLFYIPFIFLLLEAIILSKSNIEEEEVLGTAAIFIISILIGIWLLIDTFFAFGIEEDRDIYFCAPIYYFLIFEKVTLALVGGTLGSEDFEEIVLNKTIEDDDDDVTIPLLSFLCVLAATTTLFVILKPFHSAQENQLQIYPRISLLVLVLIFLIQDILPDFLLQPILFVITMISFLFFLYKLLVSHKLLYEYVGEHLEPMFFCCTDNDLSTCISAFKDFILCPRGNFDNYVDSDENLTASFFSATLLYLQYFGVILVDSIDIGSFNDVFSWTKFFSQPLVLSNISADDETISFLALAAIGGLPAIFLVSSFSRIIRNVWRVNDNSDGTLFCMIVLIATVCLIVGAAFSSLGSNNDLTFIFLSVSFGLYFFSFSNTSCRILFGDEDYMRLFTEVKTGLYVPFTLIFAESLILSISEDDDQVKLGETGILISSMVLILLLFFDTSFALAYLSRPKESEGAVDYFFLSPHYYFLIFERISFALVGGLLGKVDFQQAFLSAELLAEEEKVANLPLIGFAYILGFTTTLFVCFRPFASGEENQYQIYPRLHHLILVILLFLNGEVSEAILQIVLYVAIPTPIVIFAFFKWKQWYFGTQYTD